MKKIGLATLIAGLLALSLLLVGCGGGASEADKEKFVGFWSLSGMVADGEETSADDIKMLEDLGMYCVLTLNSDGSAELDLFGDITSGTWEAKSADTASITIDGSSVDGKLSGDQLTLESADSSMTFTKVAEHPGNAAMGTTE